jgi:ferredoxin
MPDLNARLPENEPGRYYVDRQCIDCDVCRDIARANFTRQPKNAYSFVYKQPENAAEESLCREAMEACPVEAIGCDGN